MFPLAKRKVIRGCAEHKAAGLGCATDYEAVYVGFKIPFDGTALRFKEEKGGNWLRITRPNGDRIEFAHLSQYSVSNGWVKAGQNGGITGNTGSLTSGPHLHIQVFENGVRINPENYNWEIPQPLKQQDYMFRKYNNTVYALIAGQWVGVATTIEMFQAVFGHIEVPEMSAAQFAAFPVSKLVIK